MADLPVQMAGEADDSGECPICGREMPLTRHHLYPRTTHQHCMRRMGLSKKELERDVYLCRQCHSAVHRFRDELELAEVYNTLDAIMAEPEMERWAAYAGKLKTTHCSHEALSKCRLKR